MTLTRSRARENFQRFHFHCAKTLRDALAEVYDTSIPVIGWDEYLRELEGDESDDLVDVKEEDPFGGSFAQVSTKT